MSSPPRSPPPFTPAGDQHHHRRLISPRPPPPYPHAPPSSSRSFIPMLLPVFVLFLILLCFLSIFLFRDLIHFSSILLSSRHRRHDGDGSDADGVPQSGLDPAILASFPTLPYSAVRGLQQGKCGQDCAVCLGEFAGGDVIRLLTVCCHAFHPTCIDSWLAAHATCPVCRSDLQAPPDEAAILAVREAVGGGRSGAASEDGGEGGSGRTEKTRSGARHAITIDER